MQKVRKIMAMLLAMCMLFSLLPAQFALAAEHTDGDDCIVYADENYSGHIWELTETETEGKYKLTVYAKNMTAQIFKTSLMFKQSDVTLVDPSGSFEMADEYMTAASAFVEPGKVLRAMTGLASLEGKDPTNIGNNALTGTSLFDPATDTNTTVTEDENSTYYTLNKELAVSSSASTSHWTNADSGAALTKAAEWGGATLFKYTTPTDVNCPLFSLYFIENEGASISSDTFKLGINDELHGGAGTVPDEGVDDQGAPKLTDKYENVGVYLIGFPQPEVEDQKVTFSVKDKNGNNVDSALVEVYEDSTKAKLIGSGVTSSGQTVVELPAYATYYYEITKTNYETYTGTVTVNDTAIVLDAVTLTLTEDLKYGVTFTVIDKDTGKGIPGVKLSVDNNEVVGPNHDITSGTTTDENGQITGVEYTATDHYVSVSQASGYQPVTNQKFTVNKTGENNVTIELVPVRATLKLPEIKDGEGNPVDAANVTVTVRRTSDNDTIAWGDRQSFTGTAYTTGVNTGVEVPMNSTFEITVSALNYSSNDAVIYVSVNETGTPTYYSDEALSDEIDAADLGLTIYAQDDPYYKVDIEQSTDDPSKFTATVTLKNIKAETGVFGLRYDKDLFDFDPASDFTLKNDDKIELFNADNIDPVTASTDADDIGYHVFTWRAKVGDTTTSFDTVSAEQQVATYVFTLKSNASADDITGDTFTVMPYDKTKAAQDLLDRWSAEGENYTFAYENFLMYNWRYTDEANDPADLQPYRLEEDKALMGGFYQVQAFNELEPSDVETQINYVNFEAKKASLTFIVTDYDGAAIDSALVKIYKDGTLVDTVTTDSTGIAVYPVEVSLIPVTYTYTVERMGYWDYPTKDGDVDSVTLSGTVPPDAIDVNVKMETKIYHTPELKEDTDPRNNVTGATLSGDAFAYNDRDYHFNIKPDAGYEFNLGAGEVVKVEIDGQVFTATFDAADNVYVVPADQIVGDPIGDPDVNGFPSDNIIVLIPAGSVTVTTETFTATALAGANGTVEYDTTDGGITDNVTSTDSQVVVSEMPPNSSTGLFKFKADDGYVVEKVFVNGVQIHDHDGKTEFDYDFKNVTSDNNITVTFWDGENPSTDSIITLIVGDKGQADVESPETATVRSTTKVFLNPTTDLVFATTPDDGYVLDGVEKEEDGVKTAVTPADSKYTVSAVDGKNIVVYVTFKAEDAEDTFNVFVTAYVKEGLGTISPVGILTYNKYDSPKFTLTQANEDWMAAGVDIDGTVVEFDPAETYEYTLASVEHDTSIGAIFVETAYKVVGKLDYSQGSGVTLRDVSTPATIKFTRESDGDVAYATYVGTNRTDATFEADLAQGTWTVEVSKNGYLDYVITGFVVDKTKATDGQFVFGSANNNIDTAKKITPLIGDTKWKGSAISLSDAGTVASALRTGASQTIAMRADVDDSGSAVVDDLTYIMQNYGSKYTKETYTQFCDTTTVAE